MKHINRTVKTTTMAAFIAAVALPASGAFAAASPHALPVKTAQIRQSSRLRYDAQVLDMSVDDLKAALSAQTLSQLAQEHGLTLEQLDAKARALELAQPRRGGQDNDPEVREPQASSAPPIH